MPEQEKVPTLVVWVWCILILIGLILQVRACAGVFG